MYTSSNHFVFYGALLWVTSAMSICRADLIVDFQSRQISPGSFGFIDVTIRNEAGLPDVALAGFDLSFKITDISPSAQPASGQLYFLPSFDPINFPNAPGRQSNSEQIAATYVLGSFAHKDNFNAITGGAFPQTLTSGDSTISPIDFVTYTNVAITSAPLLLARLEIGQSQPMGVLLARGQYEISLDVVSSQFYNAANPGTSALSFRAGTNGLVNVSAVPEPGALALWSVALVLAGFRRRTRCH